MKGSRRGANNNMPKEEEQYSGDEYDDEEVDAERDMIEEQLEDSRGQKSGGQSSLGGMSGGSRSVTGTLLAKAFLPSTSEVKQCLVYMDLAIKLQMIIFDLSSSLWWSSMAEIFIFLFALFVFFIDAGRMGFVWMFIPHLVRAAVGLLIVKKMPTTHEIVSGMEITPNEKIPFSQVNKYVVHGAKKTVDDFQKVVGKFMLIYVVATLVAIGLDFIVIFIGIGSLSNTNGAFSSTFVLLLGILYFFVAFYFLGWVFSVRMRLPDYAQDQITMGLFGLFKKLTLALDARDRELGTAKWIPKAPVVGDEAAPKGGKQQRN